MLVLSRREREQIDIDGQITITVLDVRGGRVRLGIEAPNSVAVRRREVLISIPEDSTHECATA